MIRTLLTLSIVSAAAAMNMGVANASPDDPTVGDRIVYEFYSDVQYNETSTWFDGDNDISQFSTTRLPTRVEGGWKGVQVVTSRSTYQSVVGSIQTRGYRAACRITVNGVEVAREQAQGRYAVASCS